MKSYLRSIKPVILKGLLAGVIYITCWAAAILVNANRDAFSSETGWWLYNRFFPGTADIAVAAILFCERKEKWWFSLLSAAALWGICIYFYPWAAINYIYTDPAHEWMDMSYKWFLWGFHATYWEIQLFVTLLLFGIICFVSNKWKQGFEDVPAHTDKKSDL